MVAAAALSLLVVTLVFAIDGFTGAAEEPTRRAAFLIQSPAASDSEVRETRPVAAVVIRPAPAVQSRPAPVAQREERERVRPDADEQSRPTFAPRVRDIGPVTTTPADTTDDSSPAPGDGVREVGDAVTSTLSGTGAAAGDVTAPLGPPVSQAVQDVLDVVIGLLEGATSGLAGALDRTAR